MPYETTEYKSVRDYRTAHPRAKTKTPISATEYEDRIIDHLRDIGAVSDAWEVAVSWVENDYVVTAGAGA